MRHLNGFLAAALCAMLLSCAPAQPDRDEMLELYEQAQEARIKEYRGYSKEAVIRACCAALLSFEPDYQFTHNPDGFFAHRTWRILLIIISGTGSNYWTVTAGEHEGGVTVEAKTWRGSTLSIVWNSTSSAEGLEHNWSMIPELYRLFFDRVDYILGVPGSRYVSCDEVESRGGPYRLDIPDRDNGLCFMGNDEDPGKN